MQMVMAVVALKCLETQLSPFPPVKDSLVMVYLFPSLWQFVLGSYPRL